MLLHLTVPIATPTSLGGSLGTQTVSPFCLALDVAHYPIRRYWRQRGLCLFPTTTPPIRCLNDADGQSESGQYPSANV